jgi:hypothetical protein
MNMTSLFASGEVTSGAAAPAESGPLVAAGRPDGLA